VVAETYARCEPSTATDTGHLSRPRQTDPIPAVNRILVGMAVDPLEGVRAFSEPWRSHATT
jgi:hypothetical protein